MIPMPTIYCLELSQKNLTFVDFAVYCSKWFNDYINLDYCNPRNPRRGFSKSIIAEFKKIRDKKAKISLKEIENKKKYLASLKKWSNARKEKEAEKNFKEKKRKSKAFNEDEKKMAKRFINMLEMAKKWSPSTTDNKDIKDLIIGQLEESIERDGLRYLKLSMPKLVSGDAYHRDLVYNLHREIKSLTEKYKDEKRNTHKRIKTTRALIDSLSRVI